MILKINMYKTLILSGGGINALLIIGALQHCFETNRITQLENIIGTSSGAIVCYLLTIGLSPIEIFNLVLEKGFDLITFKDMSFTKALNGRGVTSLDNIEKLLVSETINRHKDLFTFKTLYQKFGINLVINAYNYTTSECEYFSHTSHPNVDCIQALMASCSVPLLLPPRKLNGDYYIDGGVSSNFALPHVMEELKVDWEKEHILGIVFGNSHIDVKIDSFASILSSLMYIVPNEHLKTLGKIYKDKYDCIILSAFTSSLQPDGLTIKDMDVKELYRKFENGYNTSKKTNFIFS
jgi:predicted acylesterase/phospholipase RssA